MIQGESIFLRTLEPSDIDYLYDLENNPINWKVSNTFVPFSRDILEQYIQSAQDIFLVNQIRFIICDVVNRTPVGAIDLFEYDPINQRVGVGIIIGEKYRGSGFAQEALKEVLNYCFDVLLVHNVFCNINTSNKVSINLFEKLGFERVGVKKDWVRVNGGWEDEAVYQLLNS